MHGPVPFITSIAALALFAGCSSLSSIKGPTDGDGLVYFLPNRDIVVSVTVAGGKLTSVTATASAPYADRSKAYLLRYHASLLAKNKLEVDVGPSGLLTTTKANQTGDAVAALAGIGQLAGFTRSLSGIQSSQGEAAAPEPKLKGSCAVDGTHTFMFDVTTTTTKVCGDTLEVTIAPLGWSTTSPSLENRREALQAHSGVFYRMSRPYKVSVDGIVHSETIVFSPSGSDELFLPIARTTFANNDAQITLTNGEGVPSKYVQDTDGELAALLKIPATILTAYFGAVGTVFSSFGTNRQAEITARENEVKLELAKQKQQACIEAIQNQQDATVAALKCGER